MSARPTGPLHHLAILASAGTGKTFALAHRYIGLLGRGVEADRICALTFSRKAATEIFDSIVGYLVKAAGSPEKARLTGRQAGLDGLSQAEAAGLLRNLVSKLNRVQIGTLDSFIVGVLRAFSAELGVPSDFTLLNGDSVEARQLTQESLSFLLAPSRTHADHRETFYAAFKKATFGREEKGFSDTFFKTLESCLHLYRSQPDPQRWGDPGAIWSGDGWLGEKQGLEKALERVREAAGASDAVAKLLESLEKAAIYQPFNAWDAKAFECTIMERVFERMADLDGGCAFKFGRQQVAIDPETGKAIRLILRHLVRQEVIRSLQQTRGLGQMLHQFHALYDETIRRRGTFTFTDAQYLLTPRNKLGAGPISRLPGEADRLYIDYRLDSRLDHWLLDEFQDTSDLQWETLDNLASEIIQDRSGERSFFLVGDVKQAIHGWRGGNAKLFDELLQRYKSGIELETLSESFRSTAPVLEFVNETFGDLDGLKLPENACANWKKLWKPHVSKVDKPGCAAWVEPVFQDGEDADEAVYRAAAGLIRELDPVARGLSLAVLLPTNAGCTLMADALRRELAKDRIPIVNEGAAGLADNPVVALMRSLLKTAAHPGDKLALIHLRMSPLREAVDAAGPRLSLVLQERIQHDGFAALIREWAVRLEAAAGPLDDFGSRRLHSLLNVASTADSAGVRDPDELIARLENEQLREQTAGGAVRIMTIHQSKGLGFDAVIAPLMKNDDLRQVGQLDLLAGETADQAWILKMPRQVICKADPVLCERLEKEIAESTFASLCVLYVALTRSKQGLYAISGYGRKKRNGDRSLSAGIFLSQRLLGTDKPEEVEGESRLAGGVSLRVLKEYGDWNWATGIKAVPTPARAAGGALPVFPTRPGTLARLKRLEPSRGGEDERQADWLFKPESRGVLDFGSLIHAYLAKVEWIEESDVEAILVTARTGKPIEEAVRADAETQFRRLTADSGVRGLLARPAEPVTLWREMRFELVDGGAWISGAFDRVTVYLDKSGRPQRASLMDFKSTRVRGEADMPAAAEQYRHQLALYRRALSLILKIPEASVSMDVLFTRIAKVYTLPG